MCENCRERYLDFALPLLAFALPLLAFALPLLDLALLCL